MTEQDGEKLMKIMRLLSQCGDPVMQTYLDTNSDKMLDEKIEVLQALIDGKAPADISHYEDVLELLPKDQHWD